MHFQCIVVELKNGGCWVQGIRLNQVNFIRVPCVLIVVISRVDIEGESVNTLATVNHVGRIKVGLLS